MQSVARGMPLTDAVSGSRTAAQFQEIRPAAMLCEGCPLGRACKWAVSLYMTAELTGRGEGGGGGGGGGGVGDRVRGKER